MRWQIRSNKSDYVDELRFLYLESRKQTFTWLDPTVFKLNDFDAATAGEEILVAVAEERPVGFISWWPPDRFVHCLFIDPGYVGMGIGKALLEQCLLRIGRPVTLKCVRQNTNAVGFYKSQGWSVKDEGEAAEGKYYLMEFSD